MDWVLPLLTLTAMEVVLGIDNIVFIAILVGRLPEAQQARTRQIGLGLALVMRLALLFALSWILGLDQPIFHFTDLGVPAGWLSEHADAISWRDVILLAGGLFLIGKSTFEIHHKLEDHDADLTQVKAKASVGMVLFQIILLDMVFSIDSVITAVGMVPPEQMWVMVLAIVIAVGIMLLAAGAVSGFVNRHPTLKMLALSFLILIGVLLVAEGMGQHLDRGYIYFAMGFSLVVELLNLRLRGGKREVRASA